MVLSYADRVDLRRIRRLKILNGLLVFTIVTGMAGQLVAGVPFDESLYQTLLMFAVNYTVEPWNIACNIARYTGAIFTLSAIVSIVEGMFLILGDRLRGRGKDSVFVFGDSDASSAMMAQNKNVIDGTNGFVDAKSYVLLGSERENLDFIVRHRDRMEGKNVYFKTEVLPGLMVDNEHFMSFCLEELAAQAFWEKHALVERAYDENGNPAHLSVAVIGMGKLGEELVYYGVQELSFADVEWHLFGDTHRYQMLHRNLDKLGIHAHEAEWYDHIDVLEGADMIILSHAEDQLRILSDLFTVRAGWKIHACVRDEFDEAAREMMLQHRSGTVPGENLIIFNWKQEGGRLEQQQKAHFEEMVAKLQNVSEQVDEQQDEDDTFTRYAKRYLLGYVELEKRLAQAWPDKVNARERTRILHERMCRYYLLNNWTYSPEPVPDDPEAYECTADRTSRNLVAFDELPEEMQQLEIELVNTALAALNE